MHAEQITGLILSFNEQPNLARTLDALDWLPRIVLVDSGSSDETLAIAARYANVSVVNRAFDNFASQRNFGLEQITSQWVLSLDADHLVSGDLALEIGQLEAVGAAAFSAPFEYVIWGRPLRSSILPPRPVLLSRGNCRYVEDGHAERLVIDGTCGRLKGSIAHDDRKPLTRWLAAQDRYALQEAAKLRQENVSLGFADRLRKLNWLAPMLVFFYVLVVRGGIFDGRRGLYYAYQRLLAETLLALRRLDGENSDDAT